MATTWRVTAQRPYDELTAAGAFVPVIEVSFEVIATGTTGSVKVNAREYTPERVAELVNEAAQAMLAVDRLTG